MIDSNNPYSNQPDNYSSRKVLNPIKQNVIRFCERYCGINTFRFSIILCFVLLLVYFFYWGDIFNFNGVLMNITLELRDLISLPFLAILIDASFLFLFMHFIRVLYKSGFNSALLYITPLIWSLGLFIELIGTLSYGDFYEPDLIVKIIFQFSYISIGIIGYLCLNKVEFNWDGKVLMIISFCLFILTFYRDLTITRTIFCELTYLWFWYRIKQSVKLFYKNSNYLVKQQ
ncbi:MAG: hypothetical protein J1E16_00080 [Muribaculaceae bacterium]|nr:hypothetical protein [Muribaculaceae bacterium]